MPRLDANSVITAARCRPLRWIPPAVANSEKSPIITRRVCQLPLDKASAVAPLGTVLRSHAP